MIEWSNRTSIVAKSYVCGYCGLYISSHEGYNGLDRQNGNRTVYIYICHQCYQPTYINADNQPTPGAAFGGQVENLPMEIEELYHEICNCAKVSAYTGSVLLCRKLLMNIAVAKGAAENKNFVFYVKYLADNGYIPPNAHGWVDHIREKGNEANHEIVLMGENDAKNLILLAEMLLKIIYEFPARIPAPSATP